MRAGDNPRATALQIVGRINRATGRREGGVLGLTSWQARYVTNARTELSDPAAMGDYLKRGLRDKRFDRIVMQAMRDGKPLAKADIDRITARYSDRLLKYRGDVIARTEAIASTHAAQREAMQQLIDTGRVSASQVRKVWHSTGDGRTRDSHMMLHGETVRFDQPFISPATGAMMMHPGDVSMGAHGEDVIQCRCWMETRIDYRPNR